MLYNRLMTKGDKLKYDPEAGLPHPEAGLPHPEVVLGQELRYLERQLSNIPASGEKYSPMQMYGWVHSKVDLYRLPNQQVHENLLKALVYDNPEVRQKILQAMEIEDSVKQQGIKDSPVKVLIEKILSDLIE